MRFVFEMQGVIDAETEEAASALAEHIAVDAKALHGPTGSARPFASAPVLASCEIESLAPKVRAEVGA